MKNIYKMLICFILSSIIFIFAIGVGSVFIPPIHTINILLYKIFNFKFLEIKETILSIS